LVRHLLPTKLNFRFYLIDLPEPNAFSIAGGRVYVARKLIAMTSSEDELAGVLAHEMGHIVTHQSGIYMSRRFREVLGVTQVADRKDVFEKFHQYLENSQRKPTRGLSEQKEQAAADQVGLFAAFRSGYSPQAFVDILDRLQETHGQTGNWLTDFLVGTKPEQRRLREVIKGMTALPPGCADPRPASAAEAYGKWKEQILDYTDSAGDEVLPGLIFRNTLKLPLRPDVSNFRFSPDGKYLIAQDEGGIHILTREPLAVLFYVPAPDAYPAEFTPDSQSFIFYTRLLRVETWSIQGQSRTSVHEILMREPCLQSALSFDGKTLACLNSQSDLVLLDVASSTPILTKKQFWVPSFGEAFSLMMRVLLPQEDWEEIKFIQMKFSPDDHYFVAGHSANHLAYDVTNGREVGLPGSIRDHVADGFAFLGPDRIVVIDSRAPEQSPILRFPSGERLDQVRLARGLTLVAVTHGDYLLVGPLKEHPLGLMDLTSKKIPLSFHRGTADVYDNVLVNERLDGELALYPVGKKEPSATITLPQARLRKLRAAAVSPDLGWVAISNRTRGALWNVSQNVRVQYVRGFQGAWFSTDSMVYADFPKFQETPRAIGTLPETGSEVKASYGLGDIVARQLGEYLLVKTPKGKDPRWNCDVEVRDITTNKPIWSRHFGLEVPSLSLNSAAGTMLLGWSLAEPGGHDELRNFPDVKSRASNEDYLYEVINLRKGTASGSVLVKTNKRSVRLEGGGSDGDWVVLTATENQILTFSLSRGLERGHFFGTAPALMASAGLLALEKDARELDLYDLDSQQLRRRYVFSDPIALKRMSADGKRLLVLTASQTVYLLDTSAPN
jgi:WD40 repeat protein